MNNKSVLRIISKVGFVLVIIGFFIPIVFNKNCFQIGIYTFQFANNITDLLDVFGSSLGKIPISTGGLWILGISLFAILGFAITGVVFLILIILKKLNNIIMDWIPIGGAIVATIIASSILYYVADKFLGAGFIASVADFLRMAQDKYGMRILQPGAYVVLFGLIISLICQLVFNILIAYDKEKDKIKREELTTGIYAWGATILFVICLAISMVSGDMFILYLGYLSMWGIVAIRITIEKEHYLYGGIIGLVSGLFGIIVGSSLHFFIMKPSIIEYHFTFLYFFMIFAIVGIITSKREKKDKPTEMVTAGFVLSIIGIVFSGQGMIFLFRAMGYI